MIVDWNGRLVDDSEARISLTGQPASLSDGLYETLRSYGGLPFDVDAHLLRLADGCKALHIPLDPVQVRIRPRILALLQANTLTQQDARIRIVVHRSVNWESANPMNISVFAWPVGSQALVEQRRQGISAIIASERRCANSGLHRLKSLNLLSTAMAQMEAKSIKADDALILNERDELCEATYSNVFAMTASDQLVTPPLGTPCLPGITRGHVLRLARREGWTVSEAPLHEADLFSARELFLTSSVSEIMPIVRLNGRPVGDGSPGAVCSLLTTKYRRLVEESIRKEA